MSDMSAHLSTLRKSRQWSLRDLSEKTGLAISFLSDLERGRSNPSITSLEVVALAYDLSLADFFGGMSNFAELPADEQALLTAWREHDTIGLLRLMVERKED